MNVLLNKKMENILKERQRTQSYETIPQTMALINTLITNTEEIIYISSVLYMPSVLFSYYGIIGGVKLYNKWS
jgi:hypothetical protein